MSPFNFADKDDPKEAYKHIYDVLKDITKFFHVTQSQASCSLKSIFEGPPLDPFAFPFERGIKTEKSPSPYVWDRKI